MGILLYRERTVHLNKQQWACRAIGAGSNSGEILVFAIRNILLTDHPESRCCTE